MNAHRALVCRLAMLSPRHRYDVLMKLTGAERAGLFYDWHGWAENGQAAPAQAWRVWLMRAGRGFGKTRNGAEWVAQLGRDIPGLKVALVAATMRDARQVMVEGESGLLTVARAYGEVRWYSDKGQLKFGQDATAYLYSAEAPETLRGPEHHAAWCDELAKWRYGEATWSNLEMTLRLGKQPRVLVTTTPRPVPLMRQVMALPDCVQTGGRTVDNPYTSASFKASIVAQYGGTTLGRQELDGELIEDREGALWTRALLDGCVETTVPELVRIVVGVDPPASATGDACGIVAVGLDAGGCAWVLEDASVSGLTPAGWANAVAACAARVGADRVIAEANQGGDMVKAVLHAADLNLPVRLVRASRGKLARAEPVAALYEEGRVRHAGRFVELCDELAGLVVGGVYGGPGRSPDRADALVWAVTELTGRRRAAAGVRGL